MTSKADLLANWRSTYGELFPYRNPDAMNVDDATLALGLLLYREMELEPVPPKIKQNPVKLAQQWLGKRLVERNGGFWLDGVPVSLDIVMRATNAMLKASGMEMCLHAEKWRV